MSHDDPLIGRDATTCRLMKRVKRDFHVYTDEMCGIVQELKRRLALHLRTSAAELYVSLPHKCDGFVPMRCYAIFVGRMAGGIARPGVIVERRCVWCLPLWGLVFVGSARGVKHTENTDSLGALNYV